MPDPLWDQSYAQTSMTKLAIPCEFTCLINSVIVLASCPSNPGQV